MLFLQNNNKIFERWGPVPRPLKQPPIADFWLRAWLK